MDEEGNFRHPFLNQPSHIDTIHYPESQTFSIKLQMKKGPNKHADFVKQNFNSRRNKHKMTKWEKFRKSFKDFFGGKQSTMREAPLDNWLNLLYTGPIYMGENRERINIIWDTGSGMYLAETHDCTDCF